MTAPATGRWAGWERWLRLVCGLVVAAVAAYASYQHQQRFALTGGADATGARIWPLSVDGLVVLATLGLLRLRPDSSQGRRITLWAAFAVGIGVSLAANIAVAAGHSWQPVLVAGWPPVALLLAVELLARHNPAETSETPETSGETTSRCLEPAETPPGTVETATRPGSPAPVPPRLAPRRLTAEQIMFAYYQRELAAGRTPTGAELDRAANTNNYGRKVIARWRRTGRLPTTHPQPTAQPHPPDSYPRPVPARHG